MKSTQNLPSRLKELRKEKQYSQEYVAEQLNISRQAISHWENGKAYPDIDNLLLLAELYNISVDELLQNNVETDNNVVDVADTFALTGDHISILEMIGLAVILILSINFPFGGIITSIITICWLKHTKRKYYIIYAVCAICFLISVYDFGVLYTHINTPYGSTYLIPLD